MARLTAPTQLTLSFEWAAHEIIELVGGIDSDCKEISISRFLTGVLAWTNQGLITLSTVCHTVAVIQL